MKKKIAIVFNRMIVGGAEKALVNFLQGFDTERYDVTLFTLNDQSMYLEQLPKNVDIQFTEYKGSLKDDLKHFALGRIINGICCRLMVRLSHDQFRKFSYTVRTYPELPGQYDCAVSYKLNYEDPATVIWRIKARKKCAWMHSSLETGCEGKDSYISDLLPCLDKVFCVSKNCKAQLDGMWPQYSGKTEVLHNLFPVKQIESLAEEKMEETLCATALVTVGRLSPEKGQQLIPSALRLLLDAGYDLYWYLVGNGPLREEIERESERYGVRDRVILLGTKQNPYPYIKNCDIYVQPSFSEGYCTTTMEAKILHKPIVTTDAPGMREQFVSGENGLIVDAMTPEALAKGIKTLLDNPALMEKFRSALKLESHDHTKELQKLYDFIES